ncbi:unnamed protein product [Nesidiocoris tenuis]|uniref:Uncharacterized protein n=1 Tax=Nesidiocoris tenuis TaxID=355587 RepID=A0A6H5HV56_9HEMI|nr:unnamed protein product [Nesidiocoris tenuis]
MGRNVTVNQVANPGAAELRLRGPSHYRIPFRHSSRRRGFRLETFPSSAVPATVSLSVGRRRNMQPPGGYPGTGRTLIRRPPSDQSNFQLHYGP